VCAVVFLAGSHRLRAETRGLATARSATGDEASGTVPTVWSDQLGAVGDLVARICPPPARIDLLLSNMSSLRANEVAAIDEWLQVNLGNRRFRIVDEDPVDAHVKVTLSEGTEGYLIVTQIRHGADEQVAIFPVARSATPTERAGGIALGDQLIWEQSGNILDFALPEAAVGEPPTLIVLEVGRIAFYVRSQGQWQLNGSVTIPPSRPWLRAPRGWIDLSRGLSEATAMLSGIECQGDFGHPETIQCNFVPQGGMPWAASESWKAKNLESAGDAVLISMECNGRSVALATGSGDWTEADFVQGYEIGALKGQGAIVSGHPLELAGPVTALWPAGASGLARAVVQNLKTGNYEAHLVTATCGQ
jgi:hypothetical protein